MAPTTVRRPQAAARRTHIALQHALTLLAGAAGCRSDPETAAQHDDLTTAQASGPPGLQETPPDSVHQAFARELAAAYPGAASVATATREFDLRAAPGTIPRIDGRM